MPRRARAPARSRAARAKRKEPLDASRNAAARAGGEEGVRRAPGRRKRRRRTWRREKGFGESGGCGWGWGGACASCGARAVVPRATDISRT
eukprot:28602-Pelagococcus_subviridis.AAC.1